MPFIKQEDRNKPEESLQFGAPDEKCYRFYRDMLAEWDKAPSMETADKIFTKIMPDPHFRSMVLAFSVLLSLHVMPYIVEQRSIHGECRPKPKGITPEDNFYGEV